MAKVPKPAKQTSVPLKPADQIPGKNPKPNSNPDNLPMPGKKPGKKGPMPSGKC